MLAPPPMVGTLAVALLCLPYGSRVTRENCERIKEGMTEAEVRAILGKPWDDSLLDPEGPTMDVMLGVHVGYCRYWVGSDVGIAVVFDLNGQVVFTVLCTDPDRPRSWLPGRVWRRLRARYGW